MHFVFSVGSNCVTATPSLLLLPWTLWPNQFYDACRIGEDGVACLCRNEGPSRRGAQRCRPSRQFVVHLSHNQTKSRHTSSCGASGQRTANDDCQQWWGGRWRIPCWRQCKKHRPTMPFQKLCSHSAFVKGMKEGINKWKFNLSFFMAYLFYNKK